MEIILVGRNHKAWKRNINCTICDAVLAVSRKDLFQRIVHDTNQARKEVQCICLSCGETIIIDTNADDRWNHLPIVEKFGKYEPPEVQPDMIIFEFGGKNYEVSIEAYEKKLPIRLPDMRIAVAEWDKDLPTVLDLKILHWQAAEKVEEFTGALEI